MRIFENVPSSVVLVVPVYSVLVLPSFEVSVTMSVVGTIVVTPVTISVVVVVASMVDAEVKGSSVVAVAVTVEGVTSTKQNENDINITSFYVRLPTCK